MGTKKKYSEPNKRDGSDSYYFMHVGKDGTRKRQSSGENRKKRARDSIREFMDRMASDTSELTFAASAETYFLPDTCPHFARLRQEGHTTSINISARHFLRSTIPTEVYDFINKFNIKPNQICLEITEGALLDGEQVEKVLNQLREIGFQLSIDDFGTGYSSLSYLKKLPGNELKIDKSFIDDIVSDSRNQALVSSIISMAHGCNLKIVAEGVETIEQVDMLKKYGCDIFQGYFFSKPIDAQIFKEFIKGQKG